MPATWWWVAAKPPQGTSLGGFPETQPRDDHHAGSVGLGASGTSARRNYDPQHGASTSYDRSSSPRRARSSKWRFRNGGRTAMSFVVVGPEMLAAAATDLENIGSALSAANAAAAAPTMSLLAAAEDEVSTALAAAASAAP
ncbi:PE family protein [Mycobacterium intermedium]|uniref:PE family protein n=1 Tax=Mycobacterium intermedium TaxID=28445 RepID=UPI0031FD93E8